MNPPAPALSTHPLPCPPAHGTNTHVHVTAFLLLASALVAQEPPAGLACLARWYPVTAHFQDGQWSAVTAAGVHIPWQAGTPSLADMFTPPYATGPIVAVTQEGHDPGRTRVEALFDATYGATTRGVATTRVSLASNPVTVHRSVAPPLERVDRRLTALVGKDPSLAPFLTALGGGFNWRPVAGTQQKSPHSWGIAVDLNVERSHYWRWQKGGWKNRFPQAIVDAFEAEGFIWGGRWVHFDTMHFEYRPELLDPSCHRPYAAP